MGVEQAWTTEAHLLAFGVDALRSGNWQRGGGSGKQPEPIPRPADIKKDQESNAARLAKARAYKARQRRKPVTN